MKMLNLYVFASPPNGVEFASEVHFQFDDPGREHNHLETQILLILRGAVEADLAGRPMRLTAGDVVLIPPGLLHRLPGLPAGRCNCELLDIRLTGQSPLMRTLSDCGVVHCAAIQTELRETIRLARDLLDSQSAGASRAASAMATLWQLLALIIRSQRTVAVDTARDPSTVSKAESFMHKNLDRPVSVRRIAKEVRLSPSQLTRIFIRARGAGPAKALRQLRIHRAAELLRASDLSIKEVSTACGFTVSTHFTRVFRESIGTSPSEYRQRMVDTR